LKCAENNCQLSLRPGFGRAPVRAQRVNGSSGLI
jgi:hypothetical protein